MEKLESDWEAACLRLEDFLRAYGVEPRERLLSLTIELLAEAKRIHQPGKLPLETTMELVLERTGTWFSGLAGSPEKASRSKVAFFSIPVQDRWAGDFLSPSPPPGLVAEVRAASHEAGPALDFQSLVRKEMDYGAMEDIARETWDQFSWSHVLRAFVFWLVLFFLAYGVYLKFFA
jgi:hypothetical protein